MSTVAVAPHSSVAFPGEPADGPRPWKWTRDDVVRLAELGFFSGQRVMLIDGELLAMPPMNRDHANGIMYALQVVQAAFGPGYAVRPQLPLNLGQTTDPEPDLAVVSGPVRSHAETPTTAVLIIEVADSSLAYDLGDKASLYAAADIRDYWVVDVVHKRLHVFREPRADPAAPHGFSFSQYCFLNPGESIAPIEIPGTPIRVDDLLP
jgi:Uma2 family endonuclease